ncbi:MAG: YtpR family tRNA-binding protein [Mycoplasmatales bacterium]
MILNTFYNDVNKALILTTAKKAKNSKKNGNTTYFYDENNKIVGMNIFNVEGFNTGIVNQKDLSKDILDEFELSDNSAPFVFGYTKKVEPHPDSDKLQVCLVDLGFEEIKIVCGASNCVQDKKVVVARAGAVMPNGMSILPSKVKGVESNGMMCSFKELGITTVDASGIILLDGNDQLGSEVIIGELWNIF